MCGKKTLCTPCLNTFQVWLIWLAFRLSPQSPFCKEKSRCFPSALRLDRLSWGVTVQVASNHRHHRGFFPTWSFYMMVCDTWYSPAPVCWCQDAELMVLVFPRCASKSGVYLGGASSSHACGCHDCRMRAQERFSACWNTNLMGFAPREVFCYCKGSWQYYCQFYFFPVGLYVVDLKNAFWWEIFWYMSLWKKSDF